MGLPEQAARLRSEYPSVKKIALSFSGGLDSVVVGELLSSAGFEVLPVAVDVGQHSDFSRMEKNARKMFGSFVLKDARERFAENALRALKASFGSRGSLNSDGISRPAMAHALVTNDATKCSTPFGDWRARAKFSTKVFMIFCGTCCKPRTARAASPE